MNISLLKSRVYSSYRKKSKISAKMSERSPAGDVSVNGRVRRFSNEFMADENDVMSEKIASIPSTGSSSWLSTLGVSPKIDEHGNKTPIPPIKEEQGNSMPTTPTTPLPTPSIPVTPQSVVPAVDKVNRTPSFAGSACSYNPVPQTAPGASAAVGHDVENSIPLSIFPIAMDKYAICFCGLPGRGKTHISRRMARYLEFFHAAPVGVFNVSEYRRNLYGIPKDAEW